MKFFIANLLSLILILACHARERVLNPPLELEIPVSCQIGEDCWFVNYPDVDLTRGFHDYNNGILSQNGKKGFEIAIKNIKKEIPVLSAEDGKVILIKNDIEDNLLTDKEHEDKPFCGNYVLIEHNNDWKTLYCHLKKDSIKVKPGDFAAEGKEIGKIGLSGQTDFPHLYFALLHGGQYFDPFTGNSLTSKEGFEPLWKKSLKYSEVALVNTGVSLEIPPLNEVKKGHENPELVQDIPLFYLWLHGFHFKPGDSLKLKIANPSGEKFFEEVKKIPSSKFEQVIHFKLKKGEEDWYIGSYKGEFEFIRSKKKASSYIPKQKINSDFKKPELINRNIKAQQIRYKKEVSFEIKKSKELIDKELAEKEALKKKKLLKKRKLRIYKKLKDEEKLPDSYTKNKLKAW